ncbi:MAG: restriction endonuclease subunit S [Planctomycetes bacterium]|nr:restriction endonuclease subunit S [Planctomycetota bacterium]
MANDLRPYPEYKDSGVTWLGKVPPHWELRRIGSFAKVGNGSTPLRGKTAYWADSGHAWLNSASVHQGRITRGSRFVTDFALQECHLPRVEPGSVLVAITGQGKTRGTAALLAMDATINQHLAYITPRPDIVSGDFLRLQLMAAYAQLRAISDGSGGTKGALTCADIKTFKVAVPQPEEQTAIATFLNAHGRQVDRFIRNRHRLIELLNEQKDALINQAVTSGRDLSVRLKSSGIDWLDNLPENWKVYTIKQIARLNPSKSEINLRSDCPDRVVFLPMERVGTDGEINCSEIRPLAEVWNGYTYFRRTDVVVAKITPCFENGKGACLHNLATPFGFGTTE